jgi:hypothetical protein
VELGPDRHGNTHYSRRARGSRQISTLSVAGNSCSDYLAALPDTAATPAALTATHQLCPASASGPTASA